MTAENPSNSANKESKKRGTLLQDTSTYDMEKCKTARGKQSHVCKDSIIRDEFPS